MATFIWQRSSWPRFSWDPGRLISPLAAVRFEQGLLLGRLQMVDAVARSEAARRVIVREAADSAALEGRAGGDSTGLAQVLERFQEPLTLNALHDWRRDLNVSPLGWRSAPTGVNAAVVPPPPETLEAEVGVFLAWFNTTAAADDTDPIIRAAIGHLWWMTLRPFAHDNGVIARLLTCILLARADNGAERFYSLSAQMLQERASYELGLERTQKSSTDVTAWLVWFLGCFERALRAAPVLLGGVLSRAQLQQNASIAGLNPRQRAMVARLSEGGGSITTTRWAQTVQCSQDTAYRDILDLIAKKMLRKNEGGGRSTRYSLIAL